MELRDYLRVFRAHWLGMVLIALLVMGLSATYTFRQDKVYAASSSGLVQSTGGSKDATTTSINDSLARSRTASYAVIARSNPVAQRVIDQLGLEASPGGLIGAITVTQPEDTLLLQIRATAASPQQAKDLANAWVIATAAQVASVENPDGTNTSSIGVVPVESAQLPGGPISPQPRTNLAVGLLLGILLGLAYALVRSQLDRRLRSAPEVERRFGVPIVGQVPLAKARLDDVETTRSPATGSHGSDWGAAESFRKLRTNLAYMDVDNPPQLMVVTSPQAADGKSTVAANLAAAIAVGGVPITLVDGDLRRPTVADSLGLVEGAGLTDVLIGRAELDEVLQTHPDIDQLTVLAAGNIPPNPSELLGSKAMQALLGKLSSRGMVIIDAPPLLPVTDAAVLARHTDGAIVVVGYGKTLDTELEQGLSAVTTVQGRVLGLVFNRVPRRVAGGYGGYYNYYGSGKKSSHRARKRTEAKEARAASAAVTTDTAPKSDVPVDEVSSA